jgi:SAM-dependent methyltransferase
MNFKLTPEMIKLLCYQRSNYCDVVREAFTEDMNREYINIEPYLPHGVRDLLDIGCGLAGIDVMLATYRSVNRITLLDREGFENKSKVGFQPADEFAAYNSLGLSRRLMEQNGVQNVSYCDISKEAFPEGKFDVILSLFSWCFHYPFETYATEVTNAMHPGSVIILDVRKGHEIPWDGVVIQEGRKHKRMLIRW